MGSWLSACAGLRQQGRLADAEQHYHALLRRLQPIDALRLVELHDHRGIVLRGLQRQDCVRTASTVMAELVPTMTGGVAEK
jgi:hypothetical protein